MLRDNGPVGANNAVPMPLAELYGALEMKTVGAQEHPLGVLWPAKRHEVQKYLSDLQRWRREPPNGNSPEPEHSGLSR